MSRTEHGWRECRDCENFWKLTELAQRILLPASMVVICSVFSIDIARMGTGDPDCSNTTDPSGWTLRGRW